MPDVQAATVIEAGAHLGDCFTRVGDGLGLMGVGGGLAEAAAKTCTRSTVSSAFSTGQAIHDILHCTSLWCKLLVGAWQVIDWPIRSID
jgi:hypothetical protein